MPTPLRVTGNDTADELLNDDPFALLLGMLLDQQIPMEWAFSGPARLRERLGHLDPNLIAEMDPSEVEAVFKTKPALHRYPGSMAKRTHQLCAHLAEHYDGDAAGIWTDVKTGDKLYLRLLDLPGFGEEKAKIFLALLAKRFGRAPSGWEEAAAPFSDAELRSVADVDSPEALDKVRAYKQRLKAEGKDKQGRIDA